jgi:hypothetical protein
MAGAVDWCFSLPVALRKLGRLGARQLTTLASLATESGHVQIVSALNVSSCQKGGAKSCWSWLTYRARASGRSADLPELRTELRDEDSTTAGGFQGPPVISLRTYSITASMTLFA